MMAWGILFKDLRSEAEVSSKRQTLIFIIHLRFMKDLGGAEALDWGTAEDPSMNQMGLFDQMSCKGLLWPQKAVPVQFLGRGFSGQKSTGDDSDSCEHAGRGQPARQQRLSLRFVGQMHRTAECVHMCVCMCGCTSGKLEGEGENQPGGRNDTTGGLYVSSMKERHLEGLSLWKCSLWRSKGHGHLSTILCPILTTWCCGKKEYRLPFSKGLLWSLKFIKEEIKTNKHLYST